MSSKKPDKSDKHDMRFQCARLAAFVRSRRFVAERPETMQQVAKRIGYSRPQLSAACNGHLPPSRRMLKAFQAAYGITPESIMDGPPPPAPGPMARQCHAPLTVTGAREAQGVPVIQRRAFHCGYCRAEIAQDSRACHNCALPVDWSADWLPVAAEQERPYKPCSKENGHE